MESKRQQKFSRLIQRELAEIFQREVPHLFGGAYISVSVVRMSPDLGLARVYLSVMNAKDGNEMLLQELRVNTKTIRHLLAQRIKKQVRVIPELVFFLDDTAEYAAKIDKLFSGLDIPPAPEEDEEDDTYTR
ncbi:MULTISPECIES: 30S ribosome-binding factor RbfA [Pontibacter]|uniref:Ribosome-binding factor A n=1 Tax=Pontibacter lucknowensis TaxID=1077936 RepID=A0A1N6USY0_9BACT|nr:MULTISPECIES: 30S ribosome-binding factor RbfA [Pontibacter]EJF11435.1 ribosome-binding factor A [Pontibacter sp. BAB1700]SIQ68745.1 ribosome-binding factor A [Pontibacter lucknowensis]